MKRAEGAAMAKEGINVQDRVSARTEQIRVILEAHTKPRTIDLDSQKNGHGESRAEEVARTLRDEPGQEPQQFFTPSHQPTGA